MPVVTLKWGCVGEDGCTESTTVVSEFPCEVPAGKLLYFGLQCHRAFPYTFSMSQGSHTTELRYRLCFPNFRPGDPITIAVVNAEPYMGTKIPVGNCDVLLSLVGVWDGVLMKRAQECDLSLLDEPWGHTPFRWARLGDERFAQDIALTLWAKMLKHSTGGFIVYNDDKHPDCGLLVPKCDASDYPLLSLGQVEWQMRVLQALQKIKQLENVRQETDEFGLEMGDPVPESFTIAQQIEAARRLLDLARFPDL